MDGTTSLLNALSGQLELVHRYERLLDQSIARQFNPLKYIGRNENAATEILRDLLDPDGTHGQQGSFLALYLQSLGIRLPPEKVRDARVRTQTSTQDGRLLDLTIDIPGVAYVGLENKIDAFEQESQIPDYADFALSKRVAAWRIVFLTPSGYLPEVIDSNRRKSLLDSGNLVCHSYCENVSEWLRACAGICSAERVRLFLNDMANWAQSLETGGEMDLGKANLITELVLKDPVHLDAALAIMDNEKSLRALLLAPLMEAIMRKLQSEFPPDDWKFGREESNRNLLAELRRGNADTYAGIFMNRLSWPARCSVGIALQRKDDPCYGVFWPEWKRADTIAHAKLISAKLNSLQGRSRASDDGWPWWRPMPALGGMSQNPIHSQVIRAIYDSRRDELVNHYVELFKNLADSVSAALTDAE